MTDMQQSSPEDINHPSEASGQEVGRDKNIEFVRMRKGDLKAVPVFVQALDNQWLPRQLLGKAQEEGGITPDIDHELQKPVRAEYLRSLINGQQVVINRAFLYNNPVIARDFKQRDSMEYMAFKDFLEDGTIIPFLYSEEHPHDKPTFEVHNAFTRWVELCQEVRTHCIRLSWNTQQNERLTNDLLAKRFHQFVVGAAANNIDTFMQDLRLDSSAKEQFRKLLVQMGHLCLDLNSQGKLVTRNILYKEFVTAGENPAERRYDSSKPFSTEIKQLLDLSYNVNLPDALDGYLITPVDSLPRTALQDWRRTLQQPITTGRELLQLLQNVAFDLVQRALNVPSMDILELYDIREIRATEEWTQYIESLENLLKNPAKLAVEGVEEVYKSYAMLAEQITKRISTHPGKGSLLTTWSPGIELTFNIAGTHLFYRWTQQGPQWRLLQGKMPDMIDGDTAQIVGKLAIRDMAEEKPQQDLSTAIDFMRFTLPDVQEEWKYIVSEVKHLPGFQEIFTEAEVVDPTTSYKEPSSRG